MKMVDDLVFIFSMMYLLPLSAIGMISFYMNWILPRIKTRRGNILITRILASGHLVNSWVKPEKETTTTDEPVLDDDGNPKFDRGRKMVQTRSETGWFIKLDKKNKIIYLDTPDFVYFKGPVKRAFFDAENNQISINKAQKVVSPIGSALINSFGERMWNMGRLAAFSPRKNMDMIIFITLAAAAGSLAVGYYNYTQILELSDKMDILISTMKGVSSAVTQV